MLESSKLKKKSFNLVVDLAANLEQVSAETGLTETALVIIALRQFFASYRAVKDEAIKVA
jgi:hypothetical protein